jgi:hypothetical protein
MGVQQQQTIARSNTEAEYKALAKAAAELQWMQTLLIDLHVQLVQPPIL